MGGRTWVAPGLPPGDTPVVGVDEAEEGVESWTVNTSMIMTQRCPRCGTVKTGGWVSSKNDEPLPEPPDPPEHTQEECDMKVVDYVHDL